jgi:nicotinamidase-related amidase
MKVAVPQTTKPKALLIVDVQPNMLLDRARQLIPSMAEYIRKTEYDLYVVATWYADEHSTFHRQTRDIDPPEKTGPAAEEILSALREKRSKLLEYQKNTRSVFKCEPERLLELELKREGIEHVHLFGVDVNDCVLAAAYDATDLGFTVTVIEELSDNADGIHELKEAALLVLRRQRLTNNSQFPDCALTSVEV